MAKKQAVLIGAGKIGRGYLADLFSQIGYHLTFLEYSEELVKKMREQGYYTVNMAHADAPDEVFKISNYDAFCTQTEEEQCIRAIADTNYGSIHVFPGACESIGHMIGKAIQLRIAEGNQETLDFLICVNFLKPTQILKGYINEILSTPEEKAYLEEKVGFSECLVHRNGMVPTPEQLEKDPIAVYAGDTPHLTADGEAFKGEPPAGMNLHLIDKMEGRLTQKIWNINMRHCCTAFYGRKFGYTYYDESISNLYIVRCRDLAASEANFALCAEFGFTMQELMNIFPEKKERFDPEKVDRSEKDLLDRIGADPIRKLAKGDRFIGPALACLKHGRMPYYLARGAAMGYYFKNENDPAACEILAYVAEHGIWDAVTKYSGLSDDEPCEKLLKELIVGHYYEAGEMDPFDIEY